MTIYQMSTSKRHLAISERLSWCGLNIKSDKSGMYTYGEGAALVHYGHRQRSPHSLRLVDIDELKNVDVIDDLYFIEPDFMLFCNNGHMWNKRETKIAGYPDLVVEVWSDSNTQVDKDEKFLIYSSSDKTEHWYIEQNSNEVQCYLGKKKLENQYLAEVLKTQKGLEFDLITVSL